MRTLRATLRLSFLLLVVTALFPAALGTRLIGRLGGVRVALRAAAGVQRTWARITLWVLGVRVDAGTHWPHLRGGLLVCNHISWLDIPVLAAHGPVRFVAKGEIARWPLFGWMSSSVGTLFLSRARLRDVVSMQSELASTIEAGVLPLVFPEGRATDGLAVQRFHAGMLEIAPRGGWPCYALGLRYGAPGAVAPSPLAWHDGTPLWTHLWRALGCPHQDVWLRASGPHAPRSRRELADHLQREVARLSGLRCGVQVQSDN
jgi:1-acyl-sn-glycerol-3-phosphate acyltransferase